MSKVMTGLDVLADEGFARLAGRRLGLLAHPASVDARLRPAWRLLDASGAADVRALFGPQHGLRGETQDNMIEWEGWTEPGTGRPVHSLYGAHRKPTPAMLDGLDALVVDLQDVGARYYTFAWTVMLCLEACAEHGVQVVVLDRPNPLGGEAVEGTVLHPDWRSFVGLAPVPMRHGLTLGELAAFCRDWARLDVDLEVVPMRGWRRAMDFAATGLPWVPPSPNMPTLDTAFVYPGGCLLEGTNLSEGRGTTRPFEILGAPWLDGEALAARLDAWALPGVAWRPLTFEPTFHKFAGERCGGVQTHVTDRGAFRPVLAYTAVVAAARELAPDRFAWREPPYEYETERLPIDILAGGPAWREQLEGGAAPAELAAGWRADLDAFAAAAAPHRRYD